MILRRGVGVAGTSEHGSVPIKIFHPHPAHPGRLIRLTSDYRPYTKYRQAISRRKPVILTLPVIGSALMPCRDSIIDMQGPQVGTGRRVLYVRTGASGTASRTPMALIQKMGRSSRSAALRKTASVKAPKEMRVATRSS